MLSVAEHGGQPAKSRLFYVLRKMPKLIGHFALHRQFVKDPSGPQCPCWCCRANALFLRDFVQFVALLKFTAMGLMRRWEGVTSDSQIFSLSLLLCATNANGSDKLRKLLCNTVIQPTTNTTWRPKSKNNIYNVNRLI